MNAETAGAGLPAGGGFSPSLASRSDGEAESSRTLTAARQASSRLAHLARRVAAPRMPYIPPELRPVIEAHRDFHARADISLVVRAYNVAEKLHAGQMRRSGDPYISHPLAVAEVLAGLGVDTTTLIAALLHDTVEDTGCTLEMVAEEFGEEVSYLVDGVTKLDKMRFGEAAEAETLRKLIVALARDYRVLLIKIADRLHNMRTLSYMSPSKQKKISRVTLEVLAPLAHRLGVSVIKRELEDRAFAVLNPEEHRHISELVAEFTASERETGTMAAMVTKLRAGLAENRINGSVSVRTSHIFSIYKRAQERNRPPRDYHDIVRVLVLVDDVTDCYAALGVIHGMWRPVPGRLRDFVATPKFNMYQSLHTTVVDEAGRSVDIQIRTPAMHRLAETGIIARPVGPGADGARLEGLSWLHSLLDWQVDTVDPGEFLESLSSDLDSDEVIIFTPKGKMIALPARSSPVDVAYAVHTDVGHRAIGARVNGRLVPLHTRLRSGDVVEILTSNLPGAGPSEDWLQFVKTSRARVRIRRWLARQRRGVQVTAGRAAETAGPAAAASAAPSTASSASSTTSATSATAPAASAAAGSAASAAPASATAVMTRPAATAAQASQGAASNGTALNGAAAGGTGAALNGVALNGAASGGTASNATAPNGAALNGATSNGAALNGTLPADAAARAGQAAVRLDATAQTPAVGAAPAAAPAPAGSSSVADPLSLAADGVVVLGRPVRAAPAAGEKQTGPRAGSSASSRGRSRSGRRNTHSWAGTARVGGEEVPVRLARCCLPLPGDDVVGFTTHGGGMSLHRRECANVAAQGSGRGWVTVTEWSAPESQSFPAEIVVEAFDRYGLLADIAEVLSDTSAAVRAASTSTSEDRVAHARFTIEVTGPEQLDKVLSAVRGVGGVYDCYRACRTS